MRLSKLGFAAAALSLAWTLFIWLSRYTLSAFFAGYVSATWPRIVWIAVTVFGSVILLYETIKKPSKPNLIGLAFALLSIAITIFLVSPLIWKAG